MNIGTFSLLVLHAVFHQSVGAHTRLSTVDTAAYHAFLSTRYGRRSSAGAPPCRFLSPSGLSEESFLAEAQELGLELSTLACGARKPRKQPHLRRRERPVVFVHVHKAAGSFICGMASVNKENIMQPGVNCNWIPYDDFKHMGEGLSVPCEQRFEEWQKNQTSWGHIEREFNEDDYCPELFDYATVLRDPVSLLQSEMNFREFNTSELTSSLSCIDGHEICSESHKDDNVPLWKFIDNFQVRMLGGLETWNLPPGGVLQEHLTKVVTLLEKFNHVISFGQLAGHPELLAQHFDWSLDIIAPKDPMGDWEKTKRDLDFEFTKSQRVQIREYAKWDETLYQYFQGL